MSDKLLDFLLISGRLKNLKRTGWINHFVSNPESVSDHMYRMALISLILSKKGGDFHQNSPSAIELSLIHDLGESICGDIPPSSVSGVSDTTKYDLENKAFHHLSSLLDNIKNIPNTNLVPPPIIDWWQEFEQRQTPKSQFTRELDTFEMLLTAYEYETVQCVDLSDFFTGISLDTFTDPVLKSLSIELLHRREQNLANRSYFNRIWSKFRSGKFGTYSQTITYILSGAMVILLISRCRSIYR